METLSSLEILVGTKVPSTTPLDLYHRLISNINERVAGAKGLSYRALLPLLTGSAAIEVFVVGNYMEHVYQAIYNVVQAGYSPDCMETDEGSSGHCPPHLCRSLFILGYEKRRLYLFLNSCRVVPFSSDEEKYLVYKDYVFRELCSAVLLVYESLISRIQNQLEINRNSSKLALSEFRAIEEFEYLKVKFPHSCHFHLK